MWRETGLTDKTLNFVVIADSATPPCHLQYFSLTILTHLLVCGDMLHLHPDHLHHLHHLQVVQGAGVGAQEVRTQHLK